MSKKFLNDSQMEKAHGAGVYNYIEGGLKISVGAGLAALSTYALATEKPLGKNLYKEEKMWKNIGSGVGLGISAALLAGGVNQILEERRISKLEKKIK